MSNASQNLPDDPAFLEAMIAALQAENATLRAHGQLIQDLRLRIARLRKQVFGKSSEKIEREIQHLELALEDLLIAAEWKGFDWGTTDPLHKKGRIDDRSTSRSH